MITKRIGLKKFRHQNEAIKREGERDKEEKKTKRNFFFPNRDISFRFESSWIFLGESMPRYKARKRNEKLRIN